MGIVPQQLRGSFRSFTTNVLAGMPFAQCTACGTKVLEGWAAEGADFVIKVRRACRAVARTTVSRDTCAAS